MVFSPSGIFIIGIFTTIIFIIWHFFPIAFLPMAFLPSEFFTTGIFFRWHFYQWYFYLWKSYLWYFYQWHLYRTQYCWVVISNLPFVVHSHIAGLGPLFTTAALTWECQAFFSGYFSIDSTDVSLTVSIPCVQRTLCEPHDCVVWRFMKRSVAEEEHGIPWRPVPYGQHKLNGGDSQRRKTAPRILSPRRDPGH